MMHRLTMICMFIAAPLWRANAESDDPNVERSTSYQGICEKFVLFDADKLIDCPNSLKLVTREKSDSTLSFENPNGSTLGILGQFSETVDGAISIRVTSVIIYFRQNENSFVKSGAVATGECKVSSYKTAPVQLSCDILVERQLIKIKYHTTLSPMIQL